MPTYRLTFANAPDGEPVEPVTFTARDAAEALILAQRQDSPAQLWVGEKQLCTLSRSGTEGAFWIIS